MGIYGIEFFMWGRVRERQTQIALYILKYFDLRHNKINKVTNCRGVIPSPAPSNYPPPPPPHPTPQKNSPDLGHFRTRFWKKSGVDWNSHTSPPPPMAPSLFSTICWVLCIWVKYAYCGFSVALGLLLVSRSCLWPNFNVSQRLNCQVWTVRNIRGFLTLMLIIRKNWIRNWMIMTYFLSLDVIDYNDVINFSQFSFFPF